MLCSMFRSAAIVLKYIYYDEYISKDEDESIQTLKELSAGLSLEEAEGVIDLITVKKLSREEAAKIKEIHDMLIMGNIKRLKVICDNKRLLNRIKYMMPDASVTLLKSYKKGTPNI